jgi:glycosyltransferase involved in cell wall biosynthesis
LAGNYPFGYAEPFLEVELEYLPKYFDSITICLTHPTVDTNTEQRFKLPENVAVEVIGKPISLVAKSSAAMTQLLDTDVRNEQQIIKREYHSNVNFGKWKTIHVALRNARLIKNRLTEILADKKSDADQVYLYSYWCDDAALALAFLKRENPEVVAFCRAHSWDVYFERSKYHYLPFRHLIFNGLDAVFPISGNGRNYLVNQLAQVIDGARIIQHRLGIRKRGELKAYDRKFRRFKIVSCSNLIPIKRVHLIIETLKCIQELEVDWVHFGDGPVEEELRQLAHKHLGEKENIAYHLVGRIQNWELLKYYSDHQIDLFISLSRYDGIPVSIMEAMSFGIPALATDVGGVSEIVINQRTGFLLDVEVSPMEVAKLIKEVAQMPAKTYAQMRQEAYSIWGEFYSADINYPAFCRAVLALKN